MVVHVLDNALGQLCVSDLMTLGNLIQKYTEGVDPSIKMEDFHKLALHLVCQYHPCSVTHAQT